MSMPIISVLRRPRQEHCEFEASIGDATEKGRGRGRKEEKREGAGGQRRRRRKRD